MSENTTTTRQAKRYPSLQPAESLQVPTDGASNDTTTTRQVKRYPSLSNELEGGPSAAADIHLRGAADGAVQGQAAITETDREMERLAKRYPSILAPALAADEKAGGPAGAVAAAVAEALQIDAPDGIDGTSAEFSEFRQLAGELGLDKEKAMKLLTLHGRVLSGRR